MIKMAITAKEQLILLFDFIIHWNNLFKKGKINKQMNIKRKTSFIPEKMVTKNIIKTKKGNINMDRNLIDKLFSEYKINDNPKTESNKLTQKNDNVKASIIPNPNNRIPKS